MKIKHASIAALAAAALLLSSCAPLTYGGYNTVSYSTNGYSSSVAWTNASYDANGFPIFGYSYGRPVYGYTSDGVAIFTIAALTALCFVPHWNPAPWYRGHWHYPPRIHRVAAPPRYPHGHLPHKRPAGGLHADIHKNPGKHFGKPAVGHNNRPGIGHNNRPGSNPGIGHNNRPGIGHNNRPANNPGLGGNSRPANRPTMGGNSRPAGQNFSRPSSGSRPSASRPSGGSRPSFSRPSGGGTRPSASRPSGGGGRGPRR